MSTVKGFIIIVAMLAGGSSLAMALNGPATGDQPLTSGAAGNSATLQHLAQKTGGIRSGGAANRGYIMHGSGRYGMQHGKGYMMYRGNGR
jgi:hypothetical protein